LLLNQPLEQVLILKSHGPLQWREVPVSASVVHFSGEVCTQLDHEFADVHTPICNCVIDPIGTQSFFACSLQDAAHRTNIFFMPTYATELKFRVITTSIFFSVVSLVLLDLLS
jgi:hypothetical protein